MQENVVFGHTWAILLDVGGKAVHGMKILNTTPSGVSLGTRRRVCHCASALITVRALHLFSASHSGGGRGPQLLALHPRKVLRHPQEVLDCGRHADVSPGHPDNFHGTSLGVPKHALVPPLLASLQYDVGLFFQAACILFWLTTHIPWEA